MAGSAAAAGTGVHRFGRFEIAPANRELRVDGRPVPVGSRAFDLLLALVERRDRLVSKDELLYLAWPGLVVEESNLHVQVSALRKVLGHDAIATVAGHGYRFALQPAPAPAPARSGLPAPFSALVGREREIVELLQRLREHRLVTLTGPGGIGKTRLAIDVADKFLEALRDGAYFVDLVPVSDPRGVMDAIAGALGVAPNPTVPVADLVADHVRGRGLLVVLDNCEHLLQPAARACRALLQAGAGVRVLATSREPLHLPGEITVPLATLPVPDPEHEAQMDGLREFPGVTLFLERAAAARPGFALTRENCATVARVCRELDGIPLALELAAARLRTMSVDTLASHLGKRFAILQEPQGSVPARQQTMRATIDWSHELLAPQERALLRRLSVFRGSFDLEGAEAVGAGTDLQSDAVLHVLGALVEKSLVAFDIRNDRYHMLETVREYAQERLVAAGEDAQARGAHLRFYEALGMKAGPAMDTPAQPMWCLRLDREHDNILAAFAYARKVPEGGLVGLRMVRCYNPWATRQRVDHWLPILEQALDHPNAQEPTLLRCHALSQVAHSRSFVGRREDAYALAEESVRIARLCGDSEALAATLYRMGFTAAELGRTEEGIAYLKEGLEFARAIGDPSVAANSESAILCAMGGVYAGVGQYELAERCGLEGLACNPASRDPDSRAYQYLAVARDAVALGATGRAIDYARHAVPLMRSGASANAFEMLLSTCSSIAALRSEPALALRLAGAAEAHCRRNGIVADATDSQCHERALASVRASLDPADVEAKLAEGRSLTTQAAVAEALAWLDTLPRPA